MTQIRPLYTQAVSTHISQVMIRRPQPAPCVVCGSNSSTCQPAVRRSTNIIEPFQLKMHLCVICAAKFRPRKELDNHNRAEQFGEGHFPQASVKINSFYYKQNLSYHTKGKGIPRGFCVQHDFFETLSTAPYS